MNTPWKTTTTKISKRNGLSFPLLDYAVVIPPARNVKSLQRIVLSVIIYGHIKLNSRMIRWKMCCSVWKRKPELLD